MSGSFHTTRAFRSQQALLGSLCRKYGINNIEDVRVCNCQGRKVSFVLSFGNISFASCFTREVAKASRGEQFSDLPLVVVPDGWKVAFIVDDTAWVGEIRYTPSGRPMYRFARVEGDVEVMADESFHAKESVAFKVAQGNTQLKGFPNGRLWMGISYSEPQHRLREEFRRQRPWVAPAAEVQFQAWIDTGAYPSLPTDATSLLSQSFAAANLPVLSCRLDTQQQSASSFDMQQQHSPQGLKRTSESVVGPLGGDISGHVDKQCLTAPPPVSLSLPDLIDDEDKVLQIFGDAEHTQFSPGHRLFTPPRMYSGGRPFAFDSPTSGLARAACNSGDFAIVPSPSNGQFFSFSDIDVKSGDSCMQQQDLLDVLEEIKQGENLPLY